MFFALLATSGLLRILPVSCRRIGQVSLGALLLTVAFRVKVTDIRLVLEVLPFTSPRIPFLARVGSLELRRQFRARPPARGVVLSVAIRTALPRRPRRIMLSPKDPRPMAPPELCLVAQAIQALRPPFFVGYLELGVRLADVTRSIAQLPCLQKGTHWVPLLLRLLDLIIACLVFPASQVAERLWNAWPLANGQPRLVAF